MFWFLVILIAAVAICSRFSAPDSSLNRSAWRALDSAVTMLSRDGYEEDECTLQRSSFAAARTTGDRDAAKEPRLSTQNRAATKRKRVTPFVAKKVGALHKWRCAACGELLTEDFEVDHHISLQNGGSNDIANLRPMHKRCHLFKSSLEQRRS